MIKILIVDDHVLFSEGLASIIRAEPDIEVAGLAGTVRDAVEMAGRIQAGHYFDGFYIIGRDRGRRNTFNS